MKQSTKYSKHWKLFEYSFEFHHIILSSCYVIDQIAKFANFLVSLELMYPAYI